MGGLAVAYCAVRHWVKSLHYNDLTHKQAVAFCDEFRSLRECAKSFVHMG